MQQSSTTAIRGRSESVAWSQDGAWLAYPFWTSPRHSAIKLTASRAARARCVTTPEFRDYSPAFDPSGKYLYFLSLRTFDPVYDNVQFELSFPRAARPYLIALQADQRPPFEPEPKGMKPEDPKPRATSAEEKPARAARRSRRHRTPRRGVPGARRGGSIRSPASRATRWCGR